MTTMDGECTYCETQAALDDEGACPRCGPIRDQVRVALVNGLLPRHPLREVQTLSYVLDEGAGATCGACGQSIDGNLVGIPRQIAPHGRLKDQDIPLHPYCHVVWSREAEVSD